VIGALDRTGNTALEEEQTDQRRRLRVCEIRVRATTTTTTRNGRCSQSHIQAAK
jgi:hypothetical protein